MGSLLVCGGTQLSAAESSTDKNQSGWSRNDDRLAFLFTGGTVLGVNALCYSVREQYPEITMFTSVISAVLTTCCLSYLKKRKNICDTLDPLFNKAYGVVFGGGLSLPLSCYGGYLVFNKYLEFKK